MEVNCLWFGWIEVHLEDSAIDQYHKSLYWSDESVISSSSSTIKISFSGTSCSNITLSSCPSLKWLGVSVVSWLVGAVLEPTDGAGLDLIVLELVLLELRLKVLVFAGAGWTCFIFRSVFLRNGASLCYRFLRNDFSLQDGSWRNDIFWCGRSNLNGCLLFWRIWWQSSLKCCRWWRFIERFSS